MKLLEIAIAFYTCAVVAAAVGFATQPRGGGRLMRIVFALTLATTFGLIIVAGVIARHAS